MNPKLIRFLEGVAVVALFSGLKAVSDNLMGSGLVSGGTATIIVGLIGIVEQLISGQDKAFFGAIRRA